MTKAFFKITCPDCHESWRSPTAFPDKCPACGFRQDPEPDDDVICMPALKGVASKAGDEVYRQIEESSVRRAEMAAEMVGAPVSEMSGLKITNLNDRRDAEVAAMPVRNEVTQAMDASPQQTGMTNLGLQLSQGTRQGPMPRAGASMAAKVNDHFNGLTPGQKAGVAAEQMYKR